MLKFSKKLHLVTTIFKNFSTMKYTKTLEWIKVIDEDKKIAHIGLSNQALEQLGDIVYIDMFTDDIKKEKDEIVGEIESVKIAADIGMPVKGEIIEINPDIEDLNKINNDPENEGWLAKIIVDDLKDLDSLSDETEIFKYSK
jgi:glycine cleavage system H protein